MQGWCDGRRAKPTLTAGDAHQTPSDIARIAFLKLVPVSTGLVWRVAGETDSEAEDSEYEDEEDHVPAG